MKCIKLPMLLWLKFGDAEVRSSPQKFHDARSAKPAVITFGVENGRTLDYSTALST